MLRATLLAVIPAMPDANTIDRVGEDRRSCVLLTVYVSPVHGKPSVILIAPEDLKALEKIPVLGADSRVDGVAGRGRAVRRPGCLRPRQDIPEFSSGSFLRGSCARVRPSRSSVLNERYAVAEYLVNDGFMSCCEACEFLGGEDEDVTVVAEAFPYGVFKVASTIPARLRDHGFDVLSGDLGGGLDQCCYRIEE
jgi:hypothetical protein